MLGVRIYIAAFFDSRPRIREEAQKLDELGHSVVSGWIFGEPTGATYASSTEGYLTCCALRDLREIRTADLLILDTLDVTARSGREVELGYALGCGVPFIVVGPRRNIFHYLAQAQFDSWDEAQKWLSELRT